MTYWGVLVDSTDPCLAPNLWQRSRIVPAARGNWSSLVDGELRPSHHLLLDDRPLPGHPVVVAPVVTHYRSDAHDETDEIIGTPVPLYPFSSFTLRSSASVHGPLLLPSFVLRLRWLGSDVDSRFDIGGDGRVRCTGIGAARPMLAPCGIALDADAWFEMCGPGVDLREVLTRGGEVWGPLELVLLFGGYVQDLLTHTPTEDQVVTNRLLLAALRGEARQMYRSVPSTTEVSAVVGDQAREIPLVAGKHSGVVLAEETTTGWTVTLHLTSRSPEGRAYVQPYLGSTVYETLRDVATTCTEIEVVLSPLAAAPIQRRASDPELPTLLSELGLA